MSNTPIRYIILFAATVLLIGCERKPEPSQFQLLSSGNQVYRIDTTSGKVSKVEPGGITVVPEKETPLVVGEVYLFESGERMKYLGKGKFGAGVSGATGVDWNNPLLK